MSITAAHPTSRPLLILLIAGAAYLALFAVQTEGGTRSQAHHISPPLPTGILQTLGHSYMRQLIAEILFVKSAVYYGGVDGVVGAYDLALLAQHFQAISSLHPRLLDGYYRSESTLAHRQERYTRIANQIMERGINALPDEVAIPFFKGFNQFHYLNEPHAAAMTLKQASDIPGAPKWLAHLAAFLMADSGNIRTSIIWLKGMIASTEEKKEKERYQEELAQFNKALQVQQAIEAYVRAHGTPPENLQLLIPDQLQSLPSFDQRFTLEYKPPILSLKRHHIRKSS